MRVVYTDEALANLAEILQYVSAHYPASYAQFEKRLRIVEARIGAWPESAQKVDKHPGVRVVPLIRYPYRIFYQIERGVVEILYIHHAARREPRETGQREGAADN